MTGLVQQSSDVRFREIDLSSTLRSRSSSGAAIGFVSSKGRTTRYRVTNPQEFIAEYGIPNAAVSFGHYCGLDYLKDGNELWCLHVVDPTTARYAAAFIKDDGTGVTQAQSIVAGVPDSLNIDWGTLVVGAEIPLMVFTPKSGPGSWANSLAVRLKSSNIGPPSSVTGTSSVTGGSLSNGSYTYRVSAVSAIGETLASSALVITIAGITTAGQVTIQWDAVEGAIGYRVYGRTGTIERLATLGGGTLSFTDTGVIAPTTGVLPITSPTGLPPPARTFQVEVYDLNINTSVPQETWEVSLTDQTDNMGQQIELEHRINAFSNYVHVESYATLLTTIPVIKTTSRVNLSGGASGTAPTNGSLGLAMESAFSDPEQVAVSMFMNGGVYDVAYQQKLEFLARTRGDAFAILDAPPQYQTAQAMQDYRNLVLNIDSTYAALYGPDILSDDPYNGKKLFVPPSGYIAGVFARTEPQFSPAGRNRGGVSALGLRYEYSEPQRTSLFQAQCNYVRKFIGSGLAVFEAVTLQSKQSALSWVPVRRMVNVIKVGVKDFLQYSLHEPNDDFTRRQIVQAISEYLQFWKDARGISNFEVISDSTNNDTSRYNLGILKVTVFITPIIPVHEIEVDIVITKIGVSFSEINIQNLTNGSVTSV